MKELESVRNSLAALSSANAHLDSIIKNKTARVDQQSQEIQTKSQSIDTLSKKVRSIVFLYTHRVVQLEKLVEEDH